MSVYLLSRPTCPPIRYLSTYLSIYLSIYLVSTYLSIYLSIYLSAYLPIWFIVLSPMSLSSVCLANARVLAPTGSQSIRLSPPAFYVHTISMSVSLPKPLPASIPI